MNQFPTEMPFDVFVESRIGGRSENQDCAKWINTQFGLLVVVCDGMGGGPGGKTASTVTVDYIINEILQTDSSRNSLIACQNKIEKTIAQANEVIGHIVSEQPELSGMGTTIAAVLFHEDAAIVAHIGDSRVYKVRRLFSPFSIPEKVFRTNDHSWVGELVRKGKLTEEQARLSANTNIITRAIGANSNSEPEIDIVPYEKGDRFVLCTDGIWGSMPEPELIKLFCDNHSLSTVIEKISNIVDLYGQRKGGNHDNHTIAIIQTKKKSIQKEKKNQKARIIILLFVTVILCLLCMTVYLLTKNDDSSASANETQNLNEHSELEDKEKIERLQEENISLKSQLKTAKGQVDKKNIQKEHNNDMISKYGISSNKDSALVTTESPSVVDDNTIIENQTIYQHLKDSIWGIFDKLDNLEERDNNLFKSKRNDLIKTLNNILRNSINNMRLSEQERESVKKMKNIIDEQKYEYGEFNNVYRLLPKAKDFCKKVKNELKE